MSSDIKANTPGALRKVIAASSLHHRYRVGYFTSDLADNVWTYPGETGLDENGNDKATNGSTMIITDMWMTFTDGIL